MAAGTAELQLLIKARDEASKVLGKTQERIGKLGKTAAIAFGAAGVAAAGAGVISVKMAADFEKSMAEVATLMPGISKASFGVLQQGVLDLSKDLPEESQTNRSDSRPEVGMSDSPVLTPKE